MMFVAGDDSAHKPAVMELVSLAMLWIELAMKRGHARDFAFAKPSTIFPNLKSQASVSLKDPNPVNAKAPKRVAIVIANRAVSTTTGWPVGFWWSELTHPYFEFTEKGYHVEVFSPNGGKCDADAMSDPCDMVVCPSSCDAVRSPDRSARRRDAYRNPLQAEGFRALFVAHAVAKGPAELKERQSPRNRWRHANGAVAVCRFEVCKAARRRAGEPRTVDWCSDERLKKDRLLHARW